MGQFDIGGSRAGLEWGEVISLDLNMCGSSVRAEHSSECGSVGISCALDLKTKLSEGPKRPKTVRGHCSTHFACPSAGMATHKLLD